MVARGAYLPALTLVFPLKAVINSMLFETVPDSCVLSRLFTRFHSVDLKLLSEV